jgi:hypothetical protein
MPMMPFLAMSETQAASFREETLGDEYRLDPTLVAAGPYKGKYVLPERVLYAPEHIAHRDAFRMLNKVNMDTDVAWPPEPDADDAA